MNIQDYYTERMANCKNGYQGNYPRVLCVCSAGILRSATTSWILSNEPYNCNTRNCGVYADYALIVMDQVLIEWADHIIFAETEHYKYAKEIFSLTGKDGSIKPTYVLGVPDTFSYRDPQLVKIINNLLIDNKLDQILISKPKKSKIKH